MATSHTFRATVSLPAWTDIVQEGSAQPLLAELSTLLQNRIQEVARSLAQQAIAPGLPSDIISELSRRVTETPLTISPEEGERILTYELLNDIVLKEQKILRSLTQSSDFKVLSTLFQSVQEHPKGTELNNPSHPFAPLYSLLCQERDHSISQSTVPLGGIKVFSQDVNKELCSRIGGIQLSSQQKPKIVKPLPEKELISKMTDVIKETQNLLLNLTYVVTKNKAPFERNLSKTLSTIQTVQKRLLSSHSIHALLHLTLYQQRVSMVQSLPLDTILAINDHCLHITRALQTKDDELSLHEAQCAYLRASKLFLDEPRRDSTPINRLIEKRLNFFYVLISNRISSLEISPSEIKSAKIFWQTKKLTAPANLFMKKALLLSTAKVPIDSILLENCLHYWSPPTNLLPLATNFLAEREKISPETRKLASSLRFKIITLKNPTWEAIFPILTELTELSLSSHAPHLQCCYEELKFHNLLTQAPLISTVLQRGCPTTTLSIEQIRNMLCPLIIGGFLEIHSPHIEALHELISTLLQNPLTKDAFYSDHYILFLLRLYFSKQHNLIPSLLSLSSPDIQLEQFSALATPFLAALQDSPSIHISSIISIWLKRSLRNILERTPLVRSTYFAPMKAALQSLNSTNTLSEYQQEEQRYKQALLLLNRHLTPYIPPNLQEESIGEVEEFRALCHAARDRACTLQDTKRLVESKKMILEGFVSKILASPSEKNRKCFFETAMIEELSASLPPSLKKHLFTTSIFAFAGQADHIRQTKDLPALLRYYTSLLIAFSGPCFVKKSYFYGFLLALPQIPGRDNDPLFLFLKSLHNELSLRPKTLQTNVSELQERVQELQSLLTDKIKEISIYPLYAQQPLQALQEAQGLFNSTITEDSFVQQLTDPLLSRCIDELRTTFIKTRQITGLSPEEQIKNVNIQGQIQGTLIRIGTILKESLSECATPHYRTELMKTYKRLQECLTSLA